MHWYCIEIRDSLERVNDTLNVMLINCSHEYIKNKLSVTDETTGTKVYKIKKWSESL